MMYAVLSTAQPQTLVDVLERIPQLWDAHADPETQKRLDATIRWLRDVITGSYGMSGHKHNIESPEDAMMYLWDMAVLEQEALRVLLLDTRHHVLKTVEVVRGSVNSAQVRVAEVFREAVRHNAVAILMAHNHPSGDPTPSPDDVAFTRQVIQAGRLLDIEVLDHIIVAGATYRSLRSTSLGLW